MNASTADPSITPRDTCVTEIWIARAVAILLSVLRNLSPSTNSGRSAFGWEVAPWFRHNVLNVH